MFDTHRVCTGRWSLENFARWSHAGSDPPETVKVRATDGSATASVGDRATVVIERRRLPEGESIGQPFLVAQVIEVRDVVPGGAASPECEVDDIISNEDDYWWTACRDRRVRVVGALRWGRVTPRRYRCR